MSDSRPQAWFRVYSEIINDPKLLLLAPSDRWYFISVLALKSAGILDQTPPEKLDRVICQQLRLTAVEWEECARRLQEEGLIGDDYQPLSWDKRQYKHDSSTERVRKYRERQKTQQNQQGNACNGDVTVTETGTETETETETEEKSTSARNAQTPTPYQKIIDLYHDKLPDLPRVRVMTNKRKAAVRQRHNGIMERDLASWESYFNAVSSSDFLMGRIDGKSWRADFDFLITEKATARALEGRYHA